MWFRARFVTADNKAGLRDARNRLAKRLEVALYGLVGPLAGQSLRTAKPEEHGNVHDLRPIGVRELALPPLPSEFLAAHAEKATRLTVEKPAALRSAQPPERDFPVTFHSALSFQVKPSNRSGRTQRVG